MLAAGVLTLLPRCTSQEPFAATQSMTKDDVAKMFEGQDQFGDYPSWTKTVDQINEQVRRGALARARRRAARAGAGLCMSVLSCLCAGVGTQARRGYCTRGRGLWHALPASGTQTRWPLRRGRSTTGCGPITKAPPS